MTQCPKQRPREELVTLEMFSGSDTGETGVDLDSAFMAVFRRAAVTGKYTGEWAYLVTQPEPGQPRKFLGAFAWTETERFHYFPGYRAPVGPCSVTDSLTGRDIDHLTLELDDLCTRYGEHVAVLGDYRGSRGRPRTGAVEPGQMHPWFSLLFQDLATFSDHPAKFTATIPMPASDVVRRSAAMMGSGALIPMRFPSTEGVGPHYFQVDVWAAQGRDWDSRHANTMPWPTVAAVVAEHQYEPLHRTGWSHRFGAGSGLVVVLTRPSGTLLLEGLLQRDN